MALLVRSLDIRRPALATSCLMFLIRRSILEERDL